MTILGRASPLLAILVLLFCAVQALAAEPGKLAMGMNLSGVADWSREWAFVDVFKPARAWISQDVGGRGAWDNGKKVEVTAEGWPVLKPGQAATTLMCREVQGHYPGGLYVCTYDGSGDLAFGNDARVFARKDHRVELRVTPGNGGILLRIDRSDPKDPVRNIQVWMPGFEKAKSSFHPLLVQRLRPFKVIRFMDWQVTNGSSQVRWADRATPERTQVGPGGVALEYMIELCNELGADPWFCMPHLAHDEFVNSFATVVHERLRPELHVYVEWSNEPWNMFTGQAKWVLEQANGKGISPAFFIADESKRVWKIWGEGKGRVIRVVAGQEGAPAVAEGLMERLGGDCDALACGAYFYLQYEDLKGFNDKTTAEQVMRSCLANLDKMTLPTLAKHKSIADQWSAKTGRHIALVVYEGGQHLSASGGKVSYQKAMFEAQTHPLMYEAYDKLLKGFAACGGELFVAYNNVGSQSAWGSWGHLQYQDEPISRAPKFKALLDAAGAN
jgi:hypothetical protein